MMDVSAIILFISVRVDSKSRDDLTWITSASGPRLPCLQPQLPARCVVIQTRNRPSRHRGNKETLQRYSVKNTVHLNAWKLYYVLLHFVLYEAHPQGSLL